MFNLACIGTNIKSVTYTLENSDAYFETYSVSDFKKAHGIHEDGTTDPPSPNGDAAPSYSITSAQSLTLDYADQPIDPSKLSCILHVPFQMEGDIKALNDQLAAGSEGPDLDSLFLRLDNAAAEKAAQILAQARIELTATFEDGSTQTKSYAIAPVADFAQCHADYMKKIYKAGQGAASDEPEQPQLFTITEQTEG